MKRTYISVLLVFTVLIAADAWPSVSAQDAARLKSDLTPLGGERAANKEGTIPEWDGGYKTVPAGYKSGQPRLDPFAAEKPLFSITGATVGKYAEKLDEGQQYLLKKYPNYRIDVYPTHRTAAAPEWVYDETFKNATRATLEGYALKNAYGGIPFPIARSGVEVLWNHNLRVRAAGFSFPFNSYTIDPNGSVTLASSALNEFTIPYYIKGGSPQSLKNDVYFEVVQTVTGPPFRAGELLMFHDQMDNSRPAWQYLVGQRRVRRAPTICCDTPNFVNSGVDFFDQAFVFFGPMDRYDWKIIGKKEMYIPYNDNRYVMAHDKQAIQPHFANPDLVRWELHRVWEVEGTVRAGQRDVRPRRKVYFDEDTYIAVIGNTWDGNGTLWHTTIGFPFIEFEVPAVDMEVFLTMDLIKGTYTSTPIGDQPTQLQVVAPWPDSYYTPEALARKGVR
jgi:hypothetical protein